jgi:hypothetical protein
MGEIQEENKKCDDDDNKMNMAREGEVDSKVSKTKRKWDWGNGETGEEVK